MRRDVGDEERYGEGEAVPFIKAAALGEELVFRGEDREEKRFLAGPMASEAKERTEDRPGTVLMDEDVAPEPARAAL